MKMSEIKRPVTKRLPVFFPSTAYFIIPNPVCCMASKRVDYSLEEDNLSRQGEPSAKGITTPVFHQSNKQLEQAASSLGFCSKVRQRQTKDRG